MRTYIILLLTIGVVFFASEDGHCQIPQGYFVLHLSATKLSSYPPLNTGMPYDVMFGYIYLDSLRKQNRNFLSYSIEAMTTPDTLKYALKYLYEMSDYDPELFFEYCSSYPPLGVYHCGGELLRGLICQQASTVLRDTDRTAMLCESDIIAHVLVTDTESIRDTTRGSGFPNQIVVNCQILDVIKGQVLPICGDTLGMHRSKANSLTDSRCIQFCYSPQEPLSGTMSGDVVYTSDHMVDSVGNPWVKKGQEYIAYLSMESLGKDSSLYYYSVFPAKWHTTQGGLYPVIGGVVQDPKDDLGLGGTQSVASYLLAINNRIYSITHP